MKRSRNTDQQGVSARSGLRAVKLQELLFGGANGGGGPSLGTTVPLPMGGESIKYPDKGGE